MTFIFFGGLGLIVGSFLNVVISREGSEEGLGGRSHCTSCRHTLVFADLVPVLSWLQLRGRCRYCGAHISLQYPSVELTTALLFIAVGFAPLSPVQMIIALVIVSLALCITVYDLKHMLMPDYWNYLFAAASLLFSALSVVSGAEFLAVLLAGPLVALPLWALWAFSGGRWMGLGDVKFAVGIGWLLGFFYGYIALLGAFVIGAIISVFILLPLPTILSYAHQHGIRLLSGSDVHFTMKSEVPFGPFLIVSCITLWLMIVYGVTLPLL